MTLARSAPTRDMFGLENRRSCDDAAPPSTWPAPPVPPGFGQVTRFRWSWLGLSVLSGAVSAGSNPAMPRHCSATSVVSDSGSETGAAGRAHVWPDAVSLTAHSALTRTNPVVPLGCTTVIDMDATCGPEGVARSPVLF